MTDQTETHNLTGDDAMAFRFLSRAANAIVSASDLSKQLEATRTELQGISAMAEVLQKVRDTQEDRIATLEAQLATSIEAEARATATVAELHEVVRQRQASIDLLDGTVADLKSKLSATQAERDDYGLKHMESVDALVAAQGKLDAITEAMRKVGFNVSAMVPKPEPEPSHADYAEAHPEYRAGPTPQWDGTPPVSPSVQPEERTPVTSALDADLAARETYEHSD